MLAVSDMEVPQLYNASVAQWIGPVDLLVSCGDLPAEYLDFLASALNAPLIHVLGNHCCAPHDGTGRCESSNQLGAQDIGGRATTFTRRPDDVPLLIAGIEGSPRYNDGPHQYSDVEVELKLLALAPGLYMNKLRTGRYLDIFVTHAPPRGIHDLSDTAHRGFSAFPPFLRRFQPAIMLHGHTHRYDPMSPARTAYNGTWVINVYGHTLLDLRYNRASNKWAIEAQEKKHLHHADRRL